jgi:hypothetical protein
MGALMSWRLRGFLSGFPGRRNGGSQRVTDIAQLLHPSGVALPPQVAAQLHQAMADSLRLAFSFLLVAALAAAILTYLAPSGKTTAHQ